MKFVPGTPIEPYEGRPEWLILPDDYATPWSTTKSLSSALPPTTSSGRRGHRRVGHSFLFSPCWRPTRRRPLCCWIPWRPSRKRRRAVRLPGIPPLRRRPDPANPHHSHNRSDGHGRDRDRCEETNTGSDESGTDTSSEDQSTEQPSTEEEPATDGQEATTSEDGQTTPSDDGTPTSDEDQPQQDAAWKGDLTTTLVFDMDDANALRMLSMHGDSTVTARNATDLDNIAGKMAAGETITFSPDSIRLTDLFA